MNRILKHEQLIKDNVEQISTIIGNWKKGKGNWKREEKE
jgi:hypothetical protein